jgi:hypothetical protein
MMLTAMAVVVGGSVILFDPIFQGLAVSLMAGEVASLLISRMAVPVIYYLWMRHDRVVGTGDDELQGAPKKKGPPKRAGAGTASSPIGVKA